MSYSITGRGFAVRFTLNPTEGTHVHFIHVKPDEFAVFLTGKPPEKFSVSDSRRIAQAFRNSKFQLTIGMTSKMPGLLVTNGPQTMYGLHQAHKTALVDYNDHRGYPVKMLVMWDRTREDLNRMLLGTIRDRYRHIGMAMPSNFDFILAPE